MLFLTQGIGLLLFLWCLLVNFIYTVKFITSNCTQFELFLSHFFLNRQLFLFNVLNLTNNGVKQFNSGKCSKFDWNLIYYLPNA